MAITWNALREKIRRKELYIVSGIGLLILLLFGTGTGTITIDGKPITDYENLAPILIRIINVICGALAIVLSLHTIPNEYRRKTSHLVWIRGIHQVQFHGALALANAISSFIAQAILYSGLMVFMIIKGKDAEVWKLLPAFLIAAISILIVSLFTSALSVKLPDALAGAIAALCYFAGILHEALDLFRTMVTGFGGLLLEGIVKIVPNLNAIQAQASNLLLGKTVVAHEIWKGRRCCYLVSLLLIVFRRKEG